ncbi:type I methionyl aminopeptidase [candidate division Kazan bacterium RIFCSPHIGHO2_01_FULL_49_10]|uniref:Methionine aminopeptidase n=1 Tax=candidate division Kazan bacterium RIFCSPLOWO2_01_FULL_48_13 TaxID=1798539 RepID=A0A1F4PPQ5_UNCK3|nr:MAG: type I methionyl aminopeptidase [candidate division Kazan bacterium RIFCSPHIGHO2_01_FULL_49_10]OGB85638.1 MAG: type I methionyl aminopeptidase [candidate division Kazan bacterium RIFCSPLOWO2_01_FULL_48_13]
MTKVPTKSAAQITAMREGGAKLVEVLKSVVELVRVGVSLTELDQLAFSRIKELGAQPSFLGYQDYPATLCTSVNNGIVHCIPNSYQLQEGDLLSIDCGLIWKGMHTDSAVSVIVGRDIHGYQPLLTAVYRALLAGTAEVAAGVTVGRISRAIEESLSLGNLTIMRQFVGHGVGEKLHEAPIIPNVVGHDKDVWLPSGSVVAIEPIAGTGGEAHGTDPDGWCARTLDGAPVAHFEHTVLVTEVGGEVLTPLDSIIQFRP